jgi:IclR family transcriptional regulator, acetate operon repressor
VSTTEAFFASRSMQALEVLAFGPCTASQLAAELKVHPRTARRLLNRMVSDGWLTRRDGPRPTYTPTMRIVALAAQLAHRAPLVKHAIDVARDLQARTGKPVHMAVPSYRSALRLVRATGRAEGKPELRDLAPAHAIAGGKLLLAFRDPWREVVLESPLAPLTERTLTEPDLVRADLDETRARGYAVEDQEFRIGTQAIALPVRDGTGEVVAALALSSCKAGMPKLIEAGDEVAAAADELSGRLMQEAA